MRPIEEHTNMSGPIVRSGPTPEFSRNWDSVFAKKSAKSSAKAVATAPSKKAAKTKKKK
jgi:hypothetical protein